MNYILHFKEDASTITHWGVLGMKWGVRRTEAQLARARKKVKDLEIKSEKQKGTKRSDADDTPKPRSRSDIIKAMSDQELTAAINRITNEQRLNALLSPPPVAKKTGWDFVKTATVNAKTIGDATDVGIKLYNNFNKLQTLRGGSVLQDSKK